MKKILIILTISFISIGCISQSVPSRKYSFTIQPIIGLINSKIIDVLDSPPMYPSTDTDRILEYGIETKLMKNFNKLNVGFGLTLRSKFWPRRSTKFALKESLFCSVEFGNNDVLDSISFVTNFGLIRSSVSDKFKLFITLGPKFNMGGSHSKLNVSIHPFLSYHLNETVEKGGFDARYGTGYSYSYREVYSAFSLNLALVFEFNKLKTKPNKS
tara:strand:- start:35 stop:676 length:642 start_codon:yes stop_codon:yes gene_type:complete